MGTDYTAHVGIGYRIDRRALRVYQQTRVCIHDIAPEAKFCPTCGSPVWKQSWDYVSGYNGEKLMGHHVMEINYEDNETRAGGHDVVVCLKGCYISGGPWKPKSLPVMSDPAHKVDLLEALATVGIVPEGEPFIFMVLSAG